MSDVTDTSPQNAATLRMLHVAGDPLVLPNAWDAASARMVGRGGRIPGRGYEQLRDGPDTRLRRRGGRAGRGGAGRGRADRVGISRL
jgi:hypothetical protein